MKPTPADRADARPIPAAAPSGARHKTPERSSRARRMTQRGSSDAVLLDVAASENRLSMFTKAARQAGLEAVLDGDGPYTVFAPTDRAFAKLEKPVLDALMADPAGLADLLCHHVVATRVRAPRENAPRIANPIAGPSLSLTSEGGVFRIDAARLVKTNIRASNGVIHAIDSVLIVR